MHSVPHSQIPVGFPGHSPHYQQRPARDGESQDIISSDGHAEQLPPYSRYPTESTGKTVAFGPMPGLGEATLSRDNLIERSPTPPRQEETENSAPDGADEHQDPSQQTDDHAAMSGAAEKPSTTHKSWRAKSWKERGKTRLFCGFFPIWLLILFFSVIVVVVVICAVVIKLFLIHDADIKTPYAEANPDHLP